MEPKQKFLRPFLLSFYCSPASRKVYDQSREVLRHSDHFLHFPLPFESQPLAFIYVSGQSEPLAFLKDGVSLEKFKPPEVPVMAHIPFVSVLNGAFLGAKENATESPLQTSKGRSRDSKRRKY